MQESTAHQKQALKPEQESKVYVTTGQPAPSLSKEGSLNLTFSAAMLNLQIETLFEVIDEGKNQIQLYLSQMNELALEIEQQASPTNSEKIVEYIKLLIHEKELVAGLLAWMFVVVSVAQYAIITLDEQLPDELMNGIETLLTSIEDTLDLALTRLPSGSIFGISLAPDQKQISETKAMISDIHSRIEEIKQENEQAGEDGVTVEQNPYERILEGSSNNVSGEEFLSWLSDLDQECDV